MGEPGTTGAVGPSGADDDDLTTRVRDQTANDLGSPDAFDDDDADHDDAGHDAAARYQVSDGEPEG